MKLINIGYGNMVSSEKIVAVVSPDAAPVISESVEVEAADDTTAE